MPLCARIDDASRAPARHRLWLLITLGLVFLGEMVVRTYVGFILPRSLLNEWWVADPDLGWNRGPASGREGSTYAVMFGLIIRCFLTQSGSCWRDALVLKPHEGRALYRHVRSFLNFLDASAG